MAQHLDLTLDAAAIRRLHDEYSDAYRRYHEPSEDLSPQGLGARRRAYAAAWQKLCAARSAVEEKFAASRGWRVGKQFSFEQLCDGRARRRLGDNGWRDNEHCKHNTYFWEGRKPRAIVGHSYYDAPNFGRCVAWAKANGLHAELLPTGWYRPGSCIGVLYTRVAAGAAVCAEDPFAWITA
jgi:hypothetical protein